MKVTKKEPLPEIVYGLSADLHTRWQNMMLLRDLFPKDDKLEYAVNEFYGELMKFNSEIFKYEVVETQMFLE